MLNELKYFIALCLVVLFGCFIIRWRAQRIVFGNFFVLRESRGVIVIVSWDFHRTLLFSARPQRVC